MSAPELPEALLNPLLRRVDWRFLLPLPRVRRAVCFAGGELRDGLALVADEVVSAEDAPAGDCDLAVVADPDASMLHAASAALRPGGVCYVECTRLGPGGLRRVPGLLRDAGFERMRSYLTWRSARRASVWVPLDSPTAVRYFQRRLHARSQAHQALARLSRTLFTLGVRTGLAGTVSVVARKPGTPGAPDLEPGFIDTIRCGWSRWGLEGARGDLSLMLLTGGPRSGSKIAGLVFVAGRSDPPLIVKLARSASAGPGLVREARALRAVEARCAGGLSQIPRVVFSTNDDSLVAVGETALPGVPLLTLLSRRNCRTYARQATDWLIRLAVCSRQTEAEAAGRLVRDELAAFESNFGRVLEPPLLARTRRILASLGPVPVGCEHRDFSPWNVFVAPDGGLAVFDWESSEPAGLPVLDVLYFLTYLGSSLDRKITGAGVLRGSREVLDPATLAGAVYRECIARYTEATGLDPRHLPALRLLLWIVHSRSEHRRLAADAAGVPPDSVLRGSLFYQLWQAELMRQDAG